jgi:hypothetical protein
MSTPPLCRPSLLLLLLTACESGKARILGIEPDAPSPDSGETDSGEPPAPPAGEGPENLPSATALWLRDELESPGSITFNELLYHHPTDRGQEWIELHNPMALDMDLSGWRIEGGVDFTFPEGALIPAGGYLVIAADPAAVIGAVGPYAGTLSHTGERLTLRNATGRRIDSVLYAEDDPWPVAADGSGHSLAKINADERASLDAEYAVLRSSADEEDKAEARRRIEELGRVVRKALDPATNGQSRRSFLHWVDEVDSAAYMRIGEALLDAGCADALGATLLKKSQSQRLHRRGSECSF